jgi:RAD51-like protein 2
MEAWRLPLSPSIRGKLISAGYTCLSSIASVSSSDLARDANITEEEAFEILKLANQSCCNGSRSLINGAKNAWDMLHEEESLPRITTSCSDLDNILGGGISCRDVTEIGGVPGIGKTQIGIQLSVNVQIPRECGGLGGKAIYIGMFLLVVMTNALVDHLLGC